MIVMKFGGSSVANRSQIEKVVSIVASRADQKPVVVSSAHKGVTDALVRAAKQAAKGEAQGEAVVARQKEIAKSLGCPDDLLAPLYEELQTLLHGIRLVRELSPRSLDYVSSFGERMSVRCIADFMTRQGLQAKAYDAWTLGFITDEAFGRARPLAGYEAEMKTRFSALPSGQIPVVTGFVGRTRGGEITTVGRNGSDLSATLIGAALGAQEVQIWTDTDGVMTADPSVVEGAQNIPHMHFEEAAELAYFGSRVLHPATLVPAMKADIPVRVLNTNRPEHHGTVIQGHAPDGDPDRVTSIAYKENQLALTIRNPRMFGQSGFLAGIFEVLGRHQVVVDLISTSEVSVSVTTDDAARLSAAIDELRTHGECQSSTGKTILTVVGRQLSKQAGLGAKILTATASCGANVEMLSYAQGSINFAMLIDDQDVAAVVPHLHKILFEG